MRVYPTLNKADPKKLMEAINIIARIRKDDIAENNNQNTQINSLIMGATQTILMGATTGGLTYSMPSQTEGYKMLVGYFNGYENDSIISQTVTYPILFTNSPAITQNGTTLSLSASTAALTINAPNSTVTFTGFVKVEGF